VSDRIGPGFPGERYLPLSVVRSPVVPDGIDVGPSSPLRIAVHSRVQSVPSWTPWGPSATMGPAGLEHVPSARFTPGLLRCTDQPAWPR